MEKQTQEQIDVDTLNAIEKEISETKDFDKLLELKDKALTLKKKLGLVKPPDSPYECEGCSA